MFVPRFEPELNSNRIRDLTRSANYNQADIFFFQKKKKKTTFICEQKI